ncbi:MAG: transporter substrate-binding domain-containing protein, partial [Sulfurimonas sp.]|nr:transporter substrate-binding domain-containing protein [Sulfurimonas sp.]
MKYLYYYFTLFILLSVNLFADVNSKSTNFFNSILTQEEREYLRTNPILKVHNSLDSAPYNFIKDGKPAGYSIDYIQLLASKINLKIEFIRGYTWEEFLQLLKENKIDVVLNIIKTKEREKDFLFTASYFSIVNTVFTNKNTTYNNLNDFNGKIFSVVKSFSEKKILEEFYPNIHLLMVEDNNEAFKQLSFNKVDATINNLGVGYEVISKNGLTNIVPSFEIKDKKFNIDLRLAVNKENPLLRNILNKVQN